MGNGNAHELASRADSGLFKELLHDCFDRTLRKPDILADLSVRKTTKYPHQDSSFPFG